MKAEAAEYKEKIFFAYQGPKAEQADENVDAIRTAIKAFNKHQKSYLVESWEDFKKTTAINKDVLAGIDDASIFACDITYFNHNVLFELGYAIGKRKSILIYLNENIQGAASKYRESFLKNIRYSRLSNAPDVQSALQQHNFQSGLLERLVNIQNLELNSNDVLYVQSKIRNQPSIDLSAALESFRRTKRFLIVADDSVEIEYRPVEWYLQHIIKSRCVLIHLLGDTALNSFDENAKNSFLAGLTCGLGKQVLLVAPAKFKAPLDYHDILSSYKDADQLVSSVLEWLNRQPDIFLRQADTSTVEEAHDLDLIKLGIGCEVAEQETDDLKNYFIETSSYLAVLRQEKSVIVGRKGSGKSAIYIKAAEELAKDPTNYVVRLKPEAVELLEDVEFSNLFDSPAAKASFFLALWKRVILSKLFQLVSERISERDPQVGWSPEETAVQKFANDNATLLEMNAFGVMRELSQGKAKRKTPDLVEKMHRDHIHPMLACLKDYFKSRNTKFLRVIVLADNLDKTWDAQHELDAQADLIINLLEASPLISQMLVDAKGRRVEVRQVVFLRKDIFDYILNSVSEPDKWTTLMHEIDWEKYPTLLRKVVEDRFRHIRNLSSDALVENTWTEFFAFPGKQHPFAVIESIITRRPRDLIYFMSRLFESAVNNAHKKVDGSDLDYAINSYTSFLNNNLIAEVKAEHPKISEILAKLQEHHGKVLLYSKLEEILNSVGYNHSPRRDAFVNTLFEKGYMLGYDEKTGTPFSDISTLRQKLSEKRFFFFQNKVYVIAHAKYYYIRNGRQSPF